MYSKNKIKWKILVFFLLFYIINYSSEIFFINNNAFGLTVKTEKAENVKITDKELENDEFLIVKNLKKYFEKEIKNKKIKKIPKKDFQIQGSFSIKIKFVDIDEAIVEIKSYGFEGTNSNLVKLKFRKKDRIWDQIVYYDWTKIVEIFWKLNRLFERSFT